MITNKANIPMPMALYCVHSTYDSVAGDDYISVTGLLKPIRATVLSILHKPENETDVLDLVSSAAGTAQHERLEESIKNYKENMLKLNYPQKLIDRVRINPKDKEKGTLPIYLEQRSIKQINNYRIGGKFDLVMNDQIHDMKNVKAFSYIKNDTEDYKLQLSIYRWLNQNIVTDDIGIILMKITDWKQHEANNSKDYPPLPIIEKKIPLMSIEDTEKWIVDRLHDISVQLDNPIAIQQCNRNELWQSDDVWSYYAKIDSKRATKNFNNPVEANQMLNAKGKGKVEHRPGKVKRCNYCNAATVCTQYEQFQLAGLI